MARGLLTAAMACGGGRGGRTIGAALRAGSLAVALALSPATARALFVDGACPTSGTGAVLACGASGPFHTIGEGILAMQPGDTLEIRGAHDAFAGVYFEALMLRGGAPLPGKALACDTAQRCVVEGCRAGACPTDETPIVRGMTLRSDWGSQGGGVWARTMEASPDPDGLERDAFDPHMVMEGSASPLTPMGYAGDGIATPAPGTWSYDPGTHQIRVTPTGGADPAATVYVPHFAHNMHLQSPSANVTVQYVTFEGTRGRSIDVETLPPIDAVGIVLSHLVQRYVPRYFIIATRRAPGLIIEDSVAEYGCRGFSWALPTNGGCMGYRLFGIDGGIVRRNVVRHLGAAGQSKFGGTSPWPCPWCDAPWNDPAHTVNSAYGLAYQVKQTDTATVEDNRAEDVATGGVSLDVSRSVTVQRNTVQRAASGVAMLNFTPTAGCPTTAPSEFCYNSDHVIRANVLDQVGWADQVGCGVYVVAGSERAAGSTMLAQVYDNAISRIGFGGICVNNGGGTPTADLSIWNNTLFGMRPTPGAAPSSGLVLGDATQNVEVRDNAFDGLASDGILVSAAAAAGVSLDGDVFGTVAGCAVRWSGACAAVTAHEAHGTTGPLAFADPTADPPDLHLTPGSAAIDAGVPDPVTSDLDDHPRPQGAGWDAGAYEYGIAGPTTTTTLPPGDVARCLAGTRLLMQDAPRRLVVQSYDTPELVVGNGSDVVTLLAQGGDLRVHALGGGGFDTTYPLPAARWRLLRRRRPAFGIAYRDPVGPITSVVFKSRRMLLVKGRGPQLAQTLGSDPVVVEVELRVGPYHYRLAFGGAPQMKPHRKLVRRGAARPLSCPGA